MRILVTGSRDWTNLRVIAEVIKQVIADKAPPQVGLIHGACPTGADALADHWWEQTYGKDSIERMPANWERDGKYDAGKIRNTAMVKTDPDVVLAFVKPCRKGSCRRKDVHGSHGSMHCVREATKAHIPVLMFPEGWNGSEQP